MKAMKNIKLIAVLILLCTLHYVNSQNKAVGNKATNENETEQMPDFPGGVNELFKFINSNLNYPETARRNGVEGKVILRFVVSKTGQVQNVDVVKSVDRDLDNEAVRVVKMLPKFIPGKKNGENVPVWFTVPIAFKLDGGITENVKQPTVIPTQQVQIDSNQKTSNIKSSSQKQNNTKQFVKAIAKKKIFPIIVVNSKDSIKVECSRSDSDIIESNSIVLKWKYLNSSKSPDAAEWLLLFNGNDIGSKLPKIIMHTAEGIGVDMLISRKYLNDELLLKFKDQSGEYSSIYFKLIDIEYDKNNGSAFKKFR